MDGLCPLSLLLIIQYYGLQDEKLLICELQNG